VVEESFSLRLCVPVVKKAVIGAWIYGGDSPVKPSHDGSRLAVTAGVVMMDVWTVAVIASGQAAI
jgi:hypothetical protein